MDVEAALQQSVMDKNSVWVKNENSLEPPTAE